MKMMGIELTHVGEKPKKEGRPEVRAVDGPPKEYFPSLHLGGHEVPEALKGMEHDTEVILVAKARIASVGSNDDGGGKRYNVTLELQELGVKPYAKKKASEMSEKEATEALENGDPVDED